MKNKSTYQLIGSFCLVFFVLIGYLVKFYPETLSGIDSSIQTAIRYNITNQTTTIFKAITQMASLPTTIVLCLISLIYFYLIRERVAAVWLLAGTISIPGILVPLFKLVYSRERPLLNISSMKPQIVFRVVTAQQLLSFGSLAIIFWQILKNGIQNHNRCDCDFNYYFSRHFKNLSRRPLSK